MPTTIFIYIYMEKPTKRKKRAVVFFDSGIGGLNLLAECVKRVPRLDYFYYSDNVNVPYGNKSPQEIYALSTKILDRAAELEPQAMVIACNTVTAECIDRIRARYPFPVVGIQPAIRQAADVGGNCLVLATEATVKSRAFHSLAERFPQLDINVRACRELAAFVEGNVFSLPETLPQGLLPDAQADSVVLGCTHYVYVKRQIERRYGCPVFDGIAGTADHFAKIVGIGDHFGPNCGIFDHHGEKSAKVTFFVGDNNKNLAIFRKIMTNNV